MLSVLFAVFFPLLRISVISFDTTCSMFMLEYLQYCQILLLSKSWHQINLLFFLQIFQSASNVGLSFKLKIQSKPCLIIKIQSKIMSTLYSEILSNYWLLTRSMFWLVFFSHISSSSHEYPSSSYFFDPSRFSWLSQCQNRTKLLI